MTGAVVGDGGWAWDEEEREVAERREGEGGGDENVLFDG